MVKKMQKNNLLKLIGVLFGLSILLTCTVTALDDNNMASQAILSPDATEKGIVKENIQKFTGSQNVVISNKGIREFPLGKMYEVTTNAGDRYYVNANTGDIEVATIHNAVSTKSMDTNDIARMNETVQKFVEKNYRNFTAKKMTLVNSKIIDHGDAGKEYIYYWNEMSGDAYTVSSVMVSFNPNLDNTLTYIGFDRPLLIDTTPKISQNDAEVIARSIFKMSSAAITTSKLVIVPNGENQKLVWIVDSIELDEKGLSHGGKATVDALSGKVISINPVL